MVRSLQNAIYSRWRTKLHCLVLLGIILCPIVFGTKFIFASKDDCDRHSLDALYYEKFKPITDDIFADSLEFVSRVLDLVLDSLIKVMADLPGRKASDQTERNLFMGYNEMKKKFKRSLSKMQNNITTAWTELLSANQNMLLDVAETDLYQVRNKTGILVDTYKLARSTLDTMMLEVISVVKGVIKGGLVGIRTAAETNIQKQRKAEKKAASSDKTSQTEEEKSEEKIGEEELQIKMKNITESIVPPFLCKVTLAVLERKLNLESKSDTSELNRDSVLDDMCFDLTLMQSRIFSAVYEGLPKQKNSRDLARRNIYMYWTDLASSLYKKKIQSKGAPSMTREDKYRKMWEDEDSLVDTLVSLLEVYP